jgi:hypothetical protein
VSDFVLPLSYRARCCSRIHRLARYLRATVIVFVKLFSSPLIEPLPLAL